MITLIVDKWRKYYTSYNRFAAPPGDAGNRKMEQIEPEGDLQVDNPLDPDHFLACPAAVEDEGPVSIPPARITEQEGQLASEVARHFADSDFDSAAKVIGQLLELRPEDPQVQMNSAIIQYETGSLSANQLELKLKQIYNQLAIREFFSFFFEYQPKFPRIFFLPAPSKHRIKEAFCRSFAPQ